MLYFVIILKGRASKVIQASVVLDCSYEYIHKLNLSYDYNEKIKINMSLKQM